MTLLRLITSATRLPLASCLSSSRFAGKFNSSTPSSAAIFRFTSSAPAPASSQSAKLKNSQRKKDVDDWEWIYKMPLIKELVILNKLKFYQAGFSGLLIPASFFGSDPDLIDPILITYVGVTGVAVLSLVSFFFRDTVGYVYISESRPDLVRLAYLTFWGRRIDKIMKIEDIVPLSELPSGILGKYITKLQFHNGNENLQMIHRFGGISNQEEFTKIFGTDFEEKNS